jgi:hypothetical protein
MHKTASITCHGGKNTQHDIYVTEGKKKVKITPLKFGICPDYPLNLHLVQFTPFNYFSWSSYLHLNMICYFCFSTY